MRKNYMLIMVMLVFVVIVTMGASNPDFNPNQVAVSVYDAGDDVVVYKNNFIWLYNATGYVDSDAGTSVSDVFAGIAANSASYTAAGDVYYMKCWLFANYQPAAGAFNADAANTAGVGGSVVYWDAGTYTNTAGVQTLCLTLDSDSGTNRPVGYVVRVVTAASKLYVVRFASDYLNNSSFLSYTKTTIAAANIDITPVTDADALDIVLTDNNFTTASAIDIDAGDIVGKAGGNLIDVDFTQASTLTNDLSLIKLDGGTNVTFNTATVDYAGLEIDLDAATDTDFATFNGLLISMPTSYQGTDPTSAVYASGAGLVSALAYGTNAYYGYYGTASTSNAANGLIGISIAKNTALTTAAAGNAAVTNYVGKFSLANANVDDGGYDITCAVNAVEIDYTTANSATTAATADTLTGNALDITVTASVIDDANSVISSAAASGLFIDYNLTDAGAGTITTAAFDVIGVDYDTTGAIAYATGTYNLLKIDADDAATPTWAATSYLNGALIDVSGLKVTDGDLSLTALNLTMPATNNSAIVTGLKISGAGVDNAIQAQGFVKASYFAQDKSLWVEEFDTEIATTQLSAAVYAANWTINGTGDDVTKTVYFQSPSGALLNTATATDDNSQAYSYMIAAPYVAIDSNPIVEFRFKTDAIVTNFVCVGLVEGSFDDKGTYDDDMIVVGMDTDNAHTFGVDEAIIVTNDNAAGAVVQDGGVAISANTWVTVRIDCTDTEQPRIWIDVTGGDIDPSDEVDPASITGTIQGGIYMAPYFMVQNLAGVVDNDLYIDYIKVWQDR